MYSEFIALATRTVRERYDPSLATKEDKTSSHVKKVCQYFILCLLLYCTNPKQVLPAQILLADIVEVCGGSQQLLSVLIDWDVYHPQIPMIDLWHFMLRVNVRRIW